MKKHCIYSLQYHLVWCVKYRQKLIDEKIKIEFQQIIYKLAKKRGFWVVEINTQKDHIHMLLSCKPTHYIPEIVREMKGLTSKEIAKNNPELKKYVKDGHIWSPGYFISTASKNIDIAIQKYIKNQDQNLRQQI